MQKQQQKTIIGIMGSGIPGGANDPLAYEIGALLAKAGYVVLTGGGEGIMRAASQGAAEAGGLVIGMLPSDGPDDTRYAASYPNPYVHIPIYTGMGNARNVFNIKSSAVVIALPGGSGTLSEIALALNSGRHVVIVNWRDLLLPPSCPDHLIHYADDAASAVGMVERLLVG